MGASWDACAGLWAAWLGNLEHVCALGMCEHDHLDMCEHDHLSPSNNPLAPAGLQAREDPLHRPPPGAGGGGRQLPARG